MSKDSQKNRTLRSVVVLGLLALLVCSFQACSGCESSVKLANSRSSEAMESGGGDGRPIESKPGYYYHDVPALKCGTRERDGGVIEVTRDSLVHRKLDPNDCSEVVEKIERKDVDWTGLNPDYIGFGSGIYQRREFAPSDRPSTPPALAETWCRAEGNANLRAEVIVTEAASTKELTASIKRSRYVDGSWQAIETESRAVNRGSQGNHLAYTGTGIVLDIDRAAARGPSQFGGQLTLGGESEPVNCRLGSIYDAMTPALPSYAFNLAEGALPAGVSYSRTGSASYVGADGQIKIAAANEPRLEFDPQTRQPIGLLIEESRTNLVLHSGDLTAASWNASGLVVARDGSLAGLDRFRIQANDPSATQIWGRAGQNISIAASQVYTASVFLERGNASSARFFLWHSAGVEANIDIDLTSGTAVVSRQDYVTVSQIDIQPIANGFRVAMVFTSSVGGTLNFGPGPLSITVGDYIYATGVQIEQGSSASSYIPTAAAPGVRGADLLSVANVSWFDSQKGTMLVDFRESPGRLGRAGRELELYAFGTAGADKYSGYISAGLNYGARLSVAGSTADWASAQAALAGSVQHLSIAYGNGDSALAVAGAVERGPANAPLGLAPQSLSFGGSGTSKWSGHLRAFTYWPQRLEDRILIEQTK